MGIALITDGSCGTGWVATLQLAQRGCTVTVSFHHNVRVAMEVVNTAVVAKGKAFALWADISSESQVVVMFKPIDCEGEPLTALVSNTGILFERGTMESLTAERVNRVLATNVIGYFSCYREAVKCMSFRHGGQGGAIVNVSSVALRLGTPFKYVDHAASKGAMDMLTIGLVLETAAQGIRVNCVRPGPIYTEIRASGGEPGGIDRVKSILPMQCKGQLGEIAQAITWLLSGRALYVTGSFLGLTGGK